MRFRFNLFIFLLVLSTNVFAESFETIFSNWTDAFNRKDLINSCRLFSKDITAHYQGTPVKNYNSICDGFKKIFQESRKYQYRFKLHEIYRSNNLAAVRITWYLQVTENGKIISKIQDEGIDIFQREA